MGRKAAEFVLALETHENELQRERLTQQIAAVRADWSSKRDALMGLAKAEGAELMGLPLTADSGFDELVGLSVFVEIDGERLALKEAIERFRQRIEVNRSQTLRTSEEIAPLAQQELKGLADQLSQLQAELPCNFLVIEGWTLARVPDTI